jgi:hypothetical protein
LSRPQTEELLARELPRYQHAVENGMHRPDVIAT